ncbi:MAG: aminopeptidase P family protein [Oscillospiraceae bacterium]|nr:aminopeptidase P family protein [Oscillospiraceae bacterium]
MDRLKGFRLPDGADAALITSDVNRRYFTGMKSSAGIVVILRDEAYLIIDFRYIEKAEKTVKNCTVIKQSDNLSKQLSDIFKEHGVNTVAVESMDMTVSRLNMMKKSLTEFEFIDNDDLSRGIYDMRTVKFPDEIEKIAKAQRIAEEAFDKILKFIEPGKTEREISLMLDSYMLQGGAEELSFETIVLTGENTSMPHGVPGHTKVKNGDFVLMDFGAVVDGYHSDMTRTVCVGQPSEKMIEIYNKVLEAQQAAISFVKAGITGEELDNAAREIISSAGWGEYFGHALGHGVGMEIHEYPTASVRSKTVLQENMVVTVEPGIYLPGEFGVRIEDFVVVTEKSCVNLTKCPKNMIIL